MEPKYTTEVMQVLRQREFDLDKNDTSKDAEIMAMSPIRAFAEYTSWHLGNGWGGTVTREWPEMFGLELTPIEIKRT